jgi:hypothetical protein
MSEASAAIMPPIALLNTPAPIIGMTTTCAISQSAMPQIVPRRQRVRPFVMMSCKDVSMLMSTGDLQHASLAIRLGVRLHLAMCRRCRAFRRQLETIGGAARALSATFDEELPSAFEAAVVQRLLR